MRPAGCCPCASRWASGSARAIVSIDLRRPGAALDQGIVDERSGCERAARLRLRRERKASLLNVGWFSLFFQVALGVVASEARADGMRCGQRLISSGDSLYRVRSVCGEPDDAQRRVVTKTERRKVRAPCTHDRAGSQCSRTDEVSIDVVLDEWVYDLGENRFVRYLTFVDGRLDAVTTGSYGTAR